MTSIDGVRVLNEDEIPDLVVGVEWNQNTDDWTRINEFGDSLYVTTEDFDRHPSWRLRRCTLADNGVVNSYGSNPRGDGLALDGTDGQVMVEIPKFYVMSRSPAANIYRWWVSPVPKTGFELHPGFVQRGGIERDALYYGAYEAHWNAGSAKLESITGATVDNNKNISTFRANAAARGPRWGITNIWALSAVELLYYIEYANANSQATIGPGITGMDAGQVTGYDNADTNIGVNGTGTGVTGGAVSPAVYRGIENLWGNYWTFVDGYNAVDTEYRIIRRDGTGILQDALAIGDYEASIAVPITGGGYISNVHYEDLLKYLFVPSALGGSTTTYLCDWLYAHDPTEVNISLSGGCWDNPTTAGIAFRSWHYVLVHAAAEMSGRLEFV